MFRALTAVCILVDNLLNCFCSAGASTSDVCYAEDLREALSPFVLLLLLFSGKNTTNYYLQTLIAEDYFLISLFKGFLCCLCSHLQSSTGDLCLIKRGFNSQPFHSLSPFPLLFSPALPVGRGRSLTPFHPLPRLPEAPGAPWCHGRHTSTSEAPRRSECRARPGGGPSSRLRGARHKQRQLVTQHGVAGPRSLADAASAVTGGRAPAPEPGSDEGAAVTVTGRCQAATLRLKPAMAQRQHSPSPPVPQARGQKDHVYQGLRFCTELGSCGRVLLLDFRTLLKTA